MQPDKTKTFGLKAGANFSNFPAGPKQGIYYGFHGGLFHEMRYHNNWGYGIEFGFSNQGAYHSGHRLSNSYLSAPVMLQYYKGPVTFQAGVYGALLLDASLKMNQRKQSVAGNMPGLDYGFVAGLKMKVFEKASLGAKYQWGLEGFSPESYWNMIYNRNLQLSFYYHF